MILLVTTFILTGCEFSFGNAGQASQVSGYVTYNNEPLSGVSIIANYMTLATTNQNGFYSFVTYSATLSFSAKKSGYYFIPKTYSVSSLQTEYIFEAIEARLLTGKLILNSIKFMPTSISTFIDNNYNYTVNSINNLKISEFVLKFNQEMVVHLTQATLLEQNKFSNIVENENNFDIEIINGQTNYLFEFQIKTFFKYNNNQSESVSIEPFKILRISSILYDADLDEQNQIIFFASGNSTHNGFSYNLQLVFDYVK